MTAADSLSIKTALPGNNKFIVPETREIVLAQGIEFTNDKLKLTSHCSEKLPDSLMSSNASMVVNRADDKTPGARRIPGFAVAPFSGTEFADDKIVKVSESVFTYSSTAQKVRYRVRIINKKSEFIDALKMENVMVVYAGHSRYGRGPCFGLAGKPLGPGEWWGEGSDFNEGLFHMGYPVIGVPLEEIMEHGYTFKPCESKVAIKSGELHPELAGVKLEPINLKDSFEKELIRMKKVKSSFVNNLNNSQAAASYETSKTYWGFRKNGEMHVLINAGWDTQTASPNYLGKVTMKCKAFCHFGCSSSLHFQPILRTKKKWTSEPAYFTSAVSYESVHFWLYYLFNYNKQNCNQPLKTILKDIVGSKTATGLTTVNGQLASIDAEETAIKQMKAKKLKLYKDLEKTRTLTHDEKNDKHFWNIMYSYDYRFRIV